MNITNFINDFFYGFNRKRIVKNLPDAVFIVDDEGRISWVNDKATTIFEGGKNFLKSYFVDDLIDKGLENIEKSITTRTPIIAGAYTPSTGREFFIELNAKRYQNRFLVTIRDITAMTNILSNAEQTNQFNNEKNAMLVKIANEIKSPINSILGFSQALIDGLGGEITEKQDKYVKIINKNSNDLLYFMDKFIEFSYAESTLYEHDFQTFDVINAIQNVIRACDPDILAKGLSLNFDFEEITKRAVFSDEKTLKNILKNILDISIKLTDTGSINVKLSCPTIEELQELGIFENAKEGSLLRISISDTGIGLQETEMDDLFEPYAQTEKQNKKNFVRSLTLGTAKILTTRLRGVIWAESEVMKGTNFNIIIPIEKDFLAENE